MLDRLKRRARSLWALVDPPPAILMYHRVATPRFDPWNLAVPPDRFDAQIGWIARHRRPMPVDDLVDSLVRGSLPRGAIAVTFDDGYVDNLRHAAPVLAKHGVPATLFLATGFTPGGGQFWWDRLTDAVLASPTAANWTLRLGSDSVVLAWDAKTRADPTWRAGQPSPGPREAALVATWTILQRSSEATRATALDEIEARLPAVPEDEGRAMREQEVRELLKHGSFTLGAHSVTHPALTTLDPDALRFELVESRAACARLAGRDVPGFAYPYGDMGEGVRAAAVEAGYRWACSTEERSPPLRPSLDALLALPRLVPPSSDLVAFARALRRL